MSMGTVKLTIPGKLSSLNEYIYACRNNRFTGAKMKSVEQGKCYACIMYQLRWKRFTNPVRIEFLFCEKDSRRDIDNVSGWAHKIILDALVQANVIQDDGWKYINSIEDRFCIDKKNPHIEVRISEV